MDAEFFLRLEFQVEFNLASSKNDDANYHSKKRNTSSHIPTTQIHLE